MRKARLAAFLRVPLFEAIGMTTHVRRMIERQVAHKLQCLGNAPLVWSHLRERGIPHGNHGRSDRVVRVNALSSPKVRVPWHFMKNIKKIMVPTNILTKVPNGMNLTDHQLPLAAVASRLVDNRRKHEKIVDQLDSVSKPSDSQEALLWKKVEGTIAARRDKNDVTQSLREKIWKSCSVNSKVTFLSGVPQSFFSSLISKLFMDKFVGHTVQFTTEFEFGPKVVDILDNSKKLQKKIMSDPFSCRCGFLMDAFNVQQESINQNLTCPLHACACASLES